MWLLLNNSVMSKGGKELQRTDRWNERGDQQNIDRCRGHQQDILEEDFDEEFWIKVMATFFISF